MLIHADFSRPAIVAADQQVWVGSPQQGVDRVMLDRVGEEKARATSIVRYAAGSRFPQHRHPGGEEILVLAGTFSDEGGGYPAGWYLRNPPGSAHQPSSEPGALIFVKLRQMQPGEEGAVRIDTRDRPAWVRGRGSEPGREVCPLFSDAEERVCLQRLRTGEALFPDSSGLAGGAELLLLQGDVLHDGHSYPQGSWMRFPVGDAPGIVAGQSGSLLYLKTGHLVSLAHQEGRAG